MEVGELTKQLDKLGAEKSKEEGHLKEVMDSFKSETEVCSSSCSCSSISSCGSCSYCSSSNSCSSSSTSIWGECFL